MVINYRVKIEGVFCGTKMESFVARGKDNFEAVMFAIRKFDRISRIMLVELDENQNDVRFHVLTQKEDDVVIYHEKEDDVVIATHEYVGFDILELAERKIDDLEHKAILNQVKAKRKARV